MFEMLYRKWRYLFAYASAGMGSGYLTCHMFTFIRTVCVYGHIRLCIELTDLYSWRRMINQASDDSPRHTGHIDGAMNSITFFCWHRRQVDKNGFQFFSYILGFLGLHCILDLI
jgi:hypothetical protein